MLAKDSVLGHYRILKQIGTGGMADVYEAEDETLGRHVALKVLPPEFGRNPELVMRFEKEVRAAASLNHHGIVTVFEVGQDQGIHFYSMRLLTGGDLRSRIEAGLTQVEALAILREVADSFSHAHLRGFVHRDVKPENIIFDEQGYPIVTDFGIAKALNSNARVTATGVSMGTPRYISPEQARGRTVDPRTDLYSLGVILYEMLTGVAPYDGEDALAVIFKHVTEPIPKLPEEHRNLQPFLDKLMAKEPADRPASAKELITLIDTLLPAQATQQLRTVSTQKNPLIDKLITQSSRFSSAATVVRGDADTAKKIDERAVQQQEAVRLQNEVRIRADTDERRKAEQETTQRVEAQRHEEQQKKGEESVHIKAKDGVLKNVLPEKETQEFERQHVVAEKQSKLGAETRRQAEEKVRLEKAEILRRSPNALAETQIVRTPIAAQSELREKIDKITEPGIAPSAHKHRRSAIIMLSVILVAGSGVWVLARQHRSLDIVQPYHPLPAKSATISPATGWQTAPTPAVATPPVGTRTSDEATASLPSVKASIDVPPTRDQSLAPCAAGCAKQQVPEEVSQPHNASGAHAGVKRKKYAAVAGPTDTVVAKSPRANKPSTEQCLDLLQRASLGDNLSSTEQTTLTRDCQ